MRRVTGLIFGISLIFGLFLLFFVAPSPVVRAQVEPDVQITLLNENVTVDVGPGGTCTVEFKGIVTTEFNEYFTVIVNLEAEDTWNSATITPDEMSFSQTSPSEKPFSVKVKAPLYTSCTEDGQLLVTGRWTLYPSTVSGDCEPAKGAIDVAQYHRYDCRAINKHIKTKPGSEVELKLMITNEGNGEEMFDISIENLDELSDKGFKIELPSYSPILEPNHEHLFTFYVTVPSDISGDTVYMVNVDVALSGDASGYSSESYKLEVEGNPLLSNPLLSVTLVLILIVILIVLVYAWRQRKKGNQAE